LTISEQGGKGSRYDRLRIAAGYYDDDIGGLDGRYEIRRRPLDRGESGFLAFEIHTAARSNVQEPRIVNIVKPQLEPGDAQFGDEIETTDTCPDDRDLHGALVRHRSLPDNYSRLTAEITPRATSGRSGWR
jgi:hypothetical protein